MRRRVTGGLLALSLTVVLCACGVPTDNEVHRIDPRHVPHRLVAPATPGAQISKGSPRPTTPVPGLSTGD
jgi:hypothetical protein